MDNNIFAILTTKNRYDFFEKALNSILSQTVLPKIIIIVSDSNNNIKKREHILCKSKNKYIDQEIIYIENNYTANYAGSLNCAINYIVQLLCLVKQQKLENIFLAFLDDDDLWHNTYIEKCKNRIKSDTDFIVSGLIYEKSLKKEYLSIPNHLNLNDFLKTNPHIQGSNTFIRLTTLLKAGCFDENISSSTDRDLFCRVMMLKPNYEIIQEYLVTINIDNDRERITNNNKILGFKYFYYKYNHLMNSEIKEQFFQRNLKLFNISKSDILSNFSVHDLSSPKIFSHKKFDKMVIVGFIATDYELGLRLLTQIFEQDFSELKVIIFANFIQQKSEYERILLKNNIPFHIYNLAEVKDIFSDGHHIYQKEILSTESIITDIAISRTILHELLYQHSTNDSVAVVLDDDIEIASLNYYNGNFIREKVVLEDIIAEYQLKYDAIIGNYNNDAGLPTLSVLRLSLLDYMYNISVQNFYRKTIIMKDDYYYDLSDKSREYFEFPQPLLPNASMEKIFSGKATSRPLFNTKHLKEASTFRGGITIIFNRRLLLLPNISLKINNIIGRRSDYFWLQNAEKRGYRICTAPFSLIHNKAEKKFNINTEFGKLLKDLIGSSFTKAYGESKNNRKSFYDNFSTFYQTRLTLIIISFYRIIGLLKIISQREDIQGYLASINESDLNSFIDNAKVFLDKKTLNKSYKELLSILSHEDRLKQNYFRGILKEYYGRDKKFIKLGEGNEGIVFHDNLYVYKFLYDKSNTILKKIESFLIKYFSNISVDLVKGYTLVRYPYKKLNNYCGGYANDMAKFIRHCHNNDIIYKNIKPANFMVDDNQLMLIDFGNSFSQERHSYSYEKMILRGFQAVRYGGLNTSIWYSIVDQSYREGELSTYHLKALNYGYDNFQQILNNTTISRYDIIFNEVIATKPTKLLDYGAGSCVLANRISCEKVSTSVYDIDIESIIENKNEKICQFNTPTEIISDYYDTVICSRVLCSINSNDVVNVMTNISNSLVTGGTLFLTICNPFFNYVKNTPTQSTIDFQNYSSTHQFQKFITSSKKFRNESHRPWIYYEHLIKSFGFEIKKCVEIRSVNSDTLNTISDELLLVCTLRRKIQTHDISLLIKTNPMDADHILNNTINMVSQLEKGFRFKEKLIVVNDTTPNNRVRRYCVDNIKKLKSEIDKLIETGFIDAVIYESEHDSLMPEIYNKYFTSCSSYNFSKNNQAIYSTLLGFEKVNTRYIFQTDSDIIYRLLESGVERLYSYFSSIKELITASFSIFTTETADSFGTRFEIRSCLIDLEKLKTILPVENKLSRNKYCLNFHRAIDTLILETNRSIRIHDNNFMFIHPENKVKNDINFISLVTQSINEGNIPNTQYNNVNLQGSYSDWVKTATSNVVIYIRGNNTPAEKIMRLFDSITKQTFQDYQIVYVDIASDNGSSDYAKFLLDNCTFNFKPIFLKFIVNMKSSLFYLDFVMQNVIIDPNTIIINIDNDDFLINENALEIIVNEFNNDADLTIGNCFRFDKPTKKYTVKSFENVWDREGDNIWLHPKSFRRYLYDYVSEDFKKDDGRYLDVCTDFAIMLPMIVYAKKPVFIEEILYYFEPSVDNQNKMNSYNKNNVRKIKGRLFKLARKLYEKNNFGHRR